MHLVNLESDEWTCRAASTKEDAMSLIEGGFQYVTEMEGVKLFKKRKQPGGQQINVVFPSARAEYEHVMKELLTKRLHLDLCRVTVASVRKR